jgi:hypothetical protein
MVMRLLETTLFEAGHDCWGARGRVDGIVDAIAKAASASWSCAVSPSHSGDNALLIWALLAIKTRFCAILLEFLFLIIFSEIGFCLFCFFYQVLSVVGYV